MVEIAGLVDPEAVPDQWVAMSDGVAAVGTFVVNRNVNFKVPLTAGR